MGTKNGGGLSGTERHLGLAERGSDAGSTRPVCGAIKPELGAEAKLFAAPNGGAGGGSGDDLRPDAERLCVRGEGPNQEDLAALPEVTSHLRQRPMTC